MIKTQKITLPNHLRVLVTPMRSTEAVTVTILCRAGSRYETKDINGIAHFLEHMFFKGGERYPTPNSVADAIEGIGGSFNAFTIDEYVGYYVKVAKDKVKVAFDVLSDMLFNAKFDAAGLERERGVILEEYNMYEDTPLQKIWDDFESLMFGDHPLGWPVIGLKSVIKSVKRDDFVDYKNKLYTASNVVVSVAGNITATQAKKLTEEYLPYPKTGKKNQPLPYRDSKPVKKSKIIYKKTEQAHLLLGVPTFSYFNQDKHVSQVLAAILGSGMSSRLFASVRERLGLAYYVESVPIHYADAGYLVVRAGVDVKRVDLAIKTILGELKDFIAKPVSAKELLKAKEMLIGRTILSLEDSERVSYTFGLQELLLNKIEPIESLKRKIKGVTAEQIQNLAKQIFKDNKLHLTVIGPYKDSSKIKKAFKL